MKFLIHAWTGILLVVAGAGICAPAAEAADGKTPKKVPWELVLGAEGELRFDDNIIGLSDTEIDSLNAGTVNGEDQYGIESEDDFIFAPDFSVRFSRRPRRGRDTSLSLTLRAYDYERNSAKDYQQYAFSVRQELNRSRTHRTVLTSGVSRIPSYFLRKLKDEDASIAAGRNIRHVADYQINRAYIRVAQEVVDRLMTVTGSYARERRNYNEDFNERDASSDVFGIDLDIYPTRHIGFRVNPYYEHENRRTRGNLSASPTITDDDVGFDSNRYGVDLRWLWGADADHRNVLNGFYETERRDFSSTTPSDTGHYGRDDDIRKFGFGFRREMGPSWGWRVSGYHRENEVSIPGQSSTTFKKNVISVALTYRYERSLRAAGGK